MTVYLPAGNGTTSPTAARPPVPATRPTTPTPPPSRCTPRDGAIIPLNLNANYEFGGNIGNGVSTYTNLVFRIYPVRIHLYDYFDDAAATVKTITCDRELGAATRSTVTLPRAHHHQHPPGQHHCAQRRDQGRHGADRLQHAAAA